MPRSVAVVGASHKEGKIGYIILNNIIESGYQGKIYPINPKGGKILGKRVYKDIDDVWDEWRNFSAATPYNFKGITRERLKKESGLLWPCPTEDHPGSKIRGRRA